MNRQTPEELAAAISSFMNDMSITEEEMKVIAKVLVNDHPTLQQKHMRLACIIVDEMAQKKYHDGRNEGAVMMAQQLIRGAEKEEVKFQVRENGMTQEEAEKYVKTWKIFRLPHV